MPASVPSVFTGIRIAGAYSILVLIAAEYGRREGGARLSRQLPAIHLRNSEDVCGHLVTLGGLGLVFDHAVLFAEKRLAAWKEQA